MPVPIDWSLPNEIRMRLGDSVGRQRTMSAHGHVLILLHRVPRVDTDTRQGACFWRDPEGSWEAYLEGGGSPPGDGLQVLRRHIETFDQAVERLEQQFDPMRDVEDQYPLLQQVVRIHRTINHSCEAMQAAREAIKQDRDIITLRDRTGEIERAADLLHTDIVNALDFAIARRSEDQIVISNQINQAGYRLNILAAVFLPLMAITSLFGMNLPSGLGNNDPLLFWFILLLGLVLGYVLSVILPTLGSGKRKREPGQRKKRHTIERPANKNIDRQALRDPSPQPRTPPTTPQRMR